MTFYIAPYSYRRPRRWTRTAYAESDRDFTLAVNIAEEKDEFVLNAFVPGLKADDLNIQILDDVVRIDGEYQQDENQYLMQELPRGSFTRTLRLPVQIDADSVEARITNGVLTLTLPKAESAKPKRISIKSK